MVPLDENDVADSVDNDNDSDDVETVMSSLNVLDDAEDDD